MRERWPRFRPEIRLDAQAIGHLVRRVLPGAEIIGFAPVGGGLANTNLQVRLAGPPGAVLLRLYQRDPAQAAKEARLDRMLRDAGVPTARFHGFFEADEQTGLTASVLDWVAGARLDQRVPGADAAQLGRASGAVLAGVHAIDVGPSGFLGPDRRPPEAITLGAEAMTQYLHRCLIDGPGAARLGRGLTHAVFDFAARHGERLAGWQVGGGLVHGDCNASNFIVAGSRVAALLDWEFAFSGSPAFDFANLLRPATGDSAEFAAGLAAGYRAAGGVLPEDWRTLARITDLYAWADFLGRTTIAQELVDDAVRMVKATIVDTPQDG